jgi:uncharacterized protein DUF1844
MPEKDRGKEPIKVTDRRSFTPEGERRVPDAGRNPDAASSSQASEEAVHGQGFEMRPSPEATPGAPAHDRHPVDFSSFILSLTSTAFIHLGEMEDPVTHRLDVQLEAARQMIDIIGMLYAKTQGNLEPHEQELISGVLYELRLKYSERASGKQRRP